MIGVLFYLAIGALFHLVMIGPHFDWSSAPTWLVFFGWPLITIGFGMVLTLIVGLINAVVDCWKVP